MRRVGRIEPDEVTQEAGQVPAPAEPTPKPKAKPRKEQ